MASLADVALDAESALKPDSASHQVLTYLRTMEARDLDAAKAMLAPGFQMVFPGDCHFDSLEALIAYGKGRQGTALKTFDRFDEAEVADGTVVYAWGTLYGKKLDGETDYRDIRFVDRFLVRRTANSSARWCGTTWASTALARAIARSRPIRRRGATKPRKGAASKLALQIPAHHGGARPRRRAGHVGPGFYTIFMGGHRFASPEELVAFQKGRQQNTWKAFQRFDEIESADGTVVFLLRYPSRGTDGRDALSKHPLRRPLHRSRR